MLRILLASTRQEALLPLIEGFSSDSEVHLETVRSGVEALNAVRTAAPQLAVIDVGLPDTDPLPLVLELLRVDAMINTAVVSPLSEEEFHEASEGLGVLAHLTFQPGTSDAVELLHRLRQILGISRTAAHPA